MKNYPGLSIEEERIVKSLVDTAYKVYSELGPGFKKKVYEACSGHALTKAELEV